MRRQHIPPMVRWNPKDPDEQEFLYSYDPEYELNTDDETIEKEKIQAIIWRTNNGSKNTGKTSGDNEEGSETR